MESRECSRAKRYIDSSFQENITLDKLAEIAQINKYYFSHTFTETYGISPMNYLTQKRIFTSQELLTSTDMSLGTDCTAMWIFFLQLLYAVFP